MKHFFLYCASFSALVSLLVAGEQQLNVTAATLKDWQLTGTDTVQVDPSLSIPAGAQVSRFLAGRVLIYSLSRPTFGATTEDTPILNMGSAGVALSRDGDMGRMSLVVDGRVTGLSAKIVLAPNGRSATDLELTLMFDPATGNGAVAVGDQIVPFSAKPASDPIEVALAAGAKAPWAFTSMDVVVFSPDKSGTTSEASGGSISVAASTQVTKLAPILDRLAGAASVDSPSAPALAPASGPAPVKAGILPYSGGLSVHTRSLHQHDVGGVRAALKQNLAR